MHFFTMDTLCCIAGFGIGFIRVLMCFSHDFFVQEKAVMRKTIAMHQKRDNKHKDDDVIPTGAVPSYLLDREGVSRAKVLSNTVKQKRKEKAGKWNVPLPAVRPIAEEEVFKVFAR